MLAGDLYLADDPELARLGQRAAHLTEQFQLAWTLSRDLARTALAELLGHLGDEAVMGHRDGSAVPK